MQDDFHYYATYCAAVLAGYTHKESMDICYSSQFVDLCSATLLNKIKAPKNAATTQLQLELMDARTDFTGLQDITRIWSSFHFLPRDLYAVKPGRPKIYMDKYRLICGPNGVLVKDTVELAKNKPLTSAGIAMHVLADTWAHAYFAGTPSLVINNTVNDFIEILSTRDKDRLFDFTGTDEEYTPDTKYEKAIRFKHNPSMQDDPEKGLYINSMLQRHEYSVMNLGHGRAGHLPDYSFIRYRYMPAWGDYSIVIKDNPSDYLHAFCQMIYALKYLRGSIETFETDKYDLDAIAGYEDRIYDILTRRQLNASVDWKAFGEELSGSVIDDFDINRYQQEYMEAADNEKPSTYIGTFVSGAIAHKGMVSDSIFRSKNLLVGFNKAAVMSGGSK